MTISDTVDYDIHRVENSTLEESSDCIAIEEPLELLSVILRMMSGL